jgi:anti-anti-sigma factor
MTRPPVFRILTNQSDSRLEIAIEGELDLGKLAFLDSTGLEAIMQFDARSRAAGAEMVVVRGPRPVERLFAVMQLDQKLRIVDDPDEL